MIPYLMGIVYGILRINVEKTDEILIVYILR